VHDGIAVGDELLQRGGGLQVALYQGGAAGSQLTGLARIPDQSAYLKTLLQQAKAETAADEASGAGNGDQVTAGDQADATLRRTSSAAASS